MERDPVGEFGVVLEEIRGSKLKFACGEISFHTYFIHGFVHTFHFGTLVFTSRAPHTKPRGERRPAALSFSGRTRRFCLLKTSIEFLDDSCNYRGRAVLRSRRSHAAFAHETLYTFGRALCRLVI